MFRLSPSKEKALSEMARFALGNSATLDNIADYVAKIKGLDKRDAVIVAIMALSLSFTLQSEAEKNKTKITKKKNDKNNSTK